MLFLLTGEVQMGKTRWLESLTDELTRRGVPVAGVLAPGQWIASSGERADENGFEKIGIDNVLLPAGERIPFARRRDLAQAEGSFDGRSQAGRAELAWAIDDGAIDQVNAHFAALARDAGIGAGLLVVDELGRLELWHGGGLVGALALLDAGPTAAFPHGLIVVRDYLADEAVRRFSGTWPALMRIGPDDKSRAAVLAAFTMEPLGQNGNREVERASR